MPRRADKAKLILALSRVRDQLIIGRRILVSDWPPHHKQSEYEDELREDESAALEETSSATGFVIH